MIVEVEVDLGVTVSLFVEVVVKVCVGLGVKDRVSVWIDVIVEINSFVRYRVQAFKKRRRARIRYIGTAERLM